MRLAAHACFRPLPTAKADANLSALLAYHLDRSSIYGSSDTRGCLQSPTPTKALCGIPVQLEVVAAVKLPLATSPGTGLGKWRRLRHEGHSAADAVPGGGDPG